jgi:hypothetical protein
LGRVRFTGKAEPALDWSELESRLREIAGTSCQSSESDFPLEPSGSRAKEGRLLIEEVAPLAPVENADNHSFLTLSSQPDILNPVNAAIAPSQAVSHDRQLRLSRNY